VESSARGNHSAVKFVKATGRVQCATTAILLRVLNADSATPTRMERPARRSLRHAKGIGIARSATTTTLPGERNASDATLTKMELRVHLVAVRISEVEVAGDSVVDVEATEVDVVVAVEEDVERREVDLELAAGEDEVDSTPTNLSEDLTAKRKCRTRRSLSTTKLEL
jgi:hypothetical protein